jgi:sugar-specific transcriptional regulator TrmB
MTRYVYEYERVTLDNMEKELQNKVAELERKVAELESTILRVEKQTITIVGNFDGTNVPVTVNGIRRKIATATP